MSKKALPKTLIRALNFLKYKPGADCSSLHEASKSKSSLCYIAENLRKRGFATEENGRYTITKKGLEELPMNYEMESWLF